jgi:hypothetical protein
MSTDDTDTPDEFADLTEAAQSGLEFWDDPLDDDDRNNAASA